MTADIQKKHAGEAAARATEDDLGERPGHREVDAGLAHDTQRLPDRPQPADLPQVAEADRGHVHPAEHADEAGAAKLLEASGVEAYAPRKLIGIPAAEKALGKDAVAPLTRPGKPSYTIVAADDPRAPDNGSLTSGKAILL